MANARLLVTSSGCYAVNETGATVELEVGQETLIDDAQAAVFVKVGKAELIVNTIQPEKTKQHQKSHKG